MNQEITTSWQRLYDIATRRMEELGISKNKLPDFGGPSASWLWEVQNRKDKPSSRQKGHLDRLDVALGWEIGTSFSLARDFLEPGSPAAEDQEDRLIFGDAATRVPRPLDTSEQKIRDFATVVQQVLREMPPERSAVVMAEIARMLGIG